MEKLNVGIKVEQKQYTIFVGNDVLKQLADFIQKNHPKKKIAVITDDIVDGLHGKKMIKAIGALNPFFISIPAGESSKSRKTKEEIENRLLENKFGRDTLIIAFGGGVIGDLAGFVASTFNRGVPLIHVPTTLLAMVDSSIGGKTSVDTEHGKNLIGTVCQPAAVFSDLDFLETLPDEEFLNGLAEIIKMSIIKDKKLFDFLKNSHKKIISRDKKLLLQIIKRSAELKTEVIEKDPEEAGLRQILNFGHTFGHALESYYKYKIKHGYAVSQGMIVESIISLMTKHLPKNEEEEILSLLKLFGFPLTINMDIETGKILEFMIADKKSRNQKPRFVILEKIGKTKSQKNIFSFEVDKSIVAKAIELCKS